MTYLLMPFENDRYTYNYRNIIVYIISDFETLNQTILKIELWIY